MGKTPTTPDTQWRHQDAHPDSGGSQAAVATPAPPTASARLCRHPNTVEVPPPPSGVWLGHREWPSREAGESLIRAPSWNVSPASVTGALFPDSGRGRVFLGQALCMPPEPQGPCLGA